MRPNTSQDVQALALIEVTVSLSQSTPVCKCELGPSPLGDGVEPTPWWMLWCLGPERGKVHGLKPRVASLESHLAKTGGFGLAFLTQLEVNKRLGALVAV